MAAVRFAFELCLQTLWAHDKIRNRTHDCAKETHKPLIKNGKFYVAPHDAVGNFKQVFAHLTASGAGRPVDPQGFPDGPWTPEELADAISTIEANNSGVELRAVQGWFQDNYSGISDANIRWLARIFGCNDPEATSQWQAKLRASKVLLTKDRRALRKREKSLSPRSNGDPKASNPAEPISGGGALDPPILRNTELPSCDAASQSLGPRFEMNTSRSGLARSTEAIFSKETSLTLPLAVFTGACALALISYSLNLHSVIYSPNEGSERQVGFLWAPNWTIVFFIILPVFLSLLIDLLHRWSTELRPKLLTLAPLSSSIRSWDHSLSKASYSFWVTFFVTVLIASCYNWVVTHLRPLLKGDPGGWPMDWGRIAIVQPELVSVPATIAFSGLVFVYNGLTAYLFFAGHVFMHLMKNDFALIVRSLDFDVQHRPVDTVIHAAEQLMCGIFRCTALGLAITLMMKLQSGFLQSGMTNILDWMIADLLQFSGRSLEISGGSGGDIAAPGHIYSFLCVVAIVGTYLSAQISIRYELSRIQAKTDSAWTSPWASMNVCMTLLVISYFSIGILPGFTLLVILSLLISGYRVSKPKWQEAGAVV